MARKRRGRGESAIYEKTRRWKTRDGTVHEKTQWVAVVSLGHDAKDKGRRRRQFLYAASKKAAQDKLIAYLMKHGGKKPVSKGHILFAEFVGDFLDSIRTNPKKSANTARSYEQVLRLHVVPTFGPLRLDKVDSEHVRRLYADLRRDGRSDAMLARVHVTLRRVLNVARRRGVVTTNPMEELGDDDTPRHKTATAKTMTVEEVGKLLEAARDHRLEALFVLALTTGLRQGEIFALRWDDVNRKARSLSVRHSVQEIDGELKLVVPKSGSGRHVDLSNMVLAALDRRREIAMTESHASPYVFPSPSGGLLRKSNFLRRVYFPIRAQAGIADSLPFHALRHTSATMLLLAGISPRVVQERLGHAKVVTTLGTYSHVLPTMQRQAADAFDVLLADSSQTRPPSIGGTTSVHGTPPQAPARAPRKRKTLTE